MLRTLRAIGLCLLIIVGMAWLVGPWFRGSFFRMLADSTQYSPGYSESAIHAVQIGMTQNEVVKRLGQPFETGPGYPGVVRWYGPPGSWVGEDSGLHTPTGQLSDSAIIIFDLDGQQVASGNYAGKSADEIREILGEPIHEKIQRSVVYWHYSRSFNDGDYYRRWIGFDADGKVAEKIAYFWWD